MATKSKWQPIETAPRDGTKILTLCEFEDDQDQTGEPCAQKYTPIVLSFENSDSIWPWMDWQGDIGIRHDIPKRWMPLPDVD